MRVSKLINNIQLRYRNKEYNSIEVLIDQDNSDTSDMSDSKKSPTIFPTIKVTPTTIVCQTIKDHNIHNKLYILCIESKSTRIVTQNKSMTAIFNILEEVHANLQGPYNLPLQLRSIYTAILIYKHMQKT